MGEKNVLWNQLLKAKKAGDMDEVARLEAEIEALKMARAEERTGHKQYPKKRTYTVVGGDNWFSIAEEIYGDQRYAGLLMDANPGIDILQPGMVIETPVFAIPPGETPFFSYQTWGRVLKQNEALRAAGANPSGAHIGDYTPQDLANFFPNRDDFKWAIDIWKQENQPAPQENVPLMDGTFTPEDVLNALLDPTLWEEMGLEVAGTGEAETTSTAAPGNEPLMDAEQTPEEVAGEGEEEDEEEKDGEGSEAPSPGNQVASNVWMPLPEEEVQLTPEQEEALKTLRNWYGASLADYNMLSRLGLEIPENLNYDNLVYTFGVYEAGIKDGTYGADDVDALIYGDVDLMVAPEEEAPLFDASDLETTQNLSLLADWLIDAHPELVQPYLSADVPYDANLDCSSPQLPDGSTNAMCLAGLKAGLEWQNQYNQMIIDVIADPEGPWGQEAPEFLGQIILLYKRLVMKESQFQIDLQTGDEQARGIAQVTPETMKTLVNAGYLPPFSPDNPFGYDLFDPLTSLIAGAANLRYIYDNLITANQQSGWEMELDDLLRLTFAIYNAGPHGDFWTAERKKVAGGEYNVGCIDPTSWACLVIMFPQLTQEYIEIIFDELDSPIE